MDENLVETEYKHLFGEINSPFKLADEMISMFPEGTVYKSRITMVRSWLWTR